MDWTPHYHRAAVQGIYKLGRGAVGEVTEAIKKLLRMEEPARAGSPLEDVENTYRITINAVPQKSLAWSDPHAACSLLTRVTFALLPINGHIVEYEMPEKGNIIKILNIA